MHTNQFIDEFVDTVEKKLDSLSTEKLIDLYTLYSIKTSNKTIYEAVWSDAWCHAIGVVLRKRGYTRRSFNQDEINAESLIKLLK